MEDINKLSDEIIDDWLRIFEVLSMKNALKFQPYLRFPISISSELEVICRDFVTSVLTHIHIPNPGQPTVSLYDDSSDVDQLIQIWENTLKRLKHIGVDNEIMLTRHHIKSISNNPIVTNNKLDLWYSLFRDWSNNSSDIKFQGLDLSSNVIDGLLFIYDVSVSKMKTIRQLIDDERRLVSEAWEQFLLEKLSVGSWISNISIDQILIWQWSNIVSMLSKSDLATLDQWGRSLMGNAIRDFSLLQINLNPQDLT